MAATTDPTTALREKIAANFTAILQSICPQSKIKDENINVVISGSTRAIRAEVTYGAETETNKSSIKTNNPSETMLSALCELLIQTERVMDSSPLYAQQQHLSMLKLAGLEEKEETTAKFQPLQETKKKERMNESAAPLQTFGSLDGVALYIPGGNAMSADPKSDVLARKHIEQLETVFHSLGMATGSLSHAKGASLSTYLQSANALAQQLHARVQARVMDSYVCAANAAAYHASSTLDDSTAIHNPIVNVLSNEILEAAKHNESANPFRVDERFLSPGPKHRAVEPRHPFLHDEGGVAWDWSSCTEDYVEGIVPLLEDGNVDWASMGRRGKPSSFRPPTPFDSDDEGRWARPARKVDETQLDTYWRCIVDGTFD